MTADVFSSKQVWAIIAIAVLVILVIILLVRGGG
jgi:hypothetical protein